MSRVLSNVTNVNIEITKGTKSPQTFSIAKRMAWAANRKNTRPEVTAYCLMRLFNVNMAMLYGEEEKAFVRLQEEIMKGSDDEYHFAWKDMEALDEAERGLLATSVRLFEGSGDVISYSLWEA